jgi:hypothetical protein
MSSLTGLRVLLIIAMYAYEVTMNLSFLYVIIAISTSVILTAVTLTEFQMMTGFAEIVQMRWKKNKEGDNLEKIGDERVFKQKGNRQKLGVPIPTLMSLKIWMRLSLIVTSPVS